MIFRLRFILARHLQLDYCPLSGMIDRPSAEAKRRQGFLPKQTLVEDRSAQRPATGSVCRRGWAHVLA